MLELPPRCANEALPKKKKAFDVILRAAKDKELWLWKQTNMRIFHEIFSEKIN